VPGVGRTVGPSGPPEPTRESPIVRAQNV
jgi:hypothetical protein